MNPTTPATPVSNTTTGNISTIKKTYIKYGLIMCLPVLLCLSIMEITGKNQSFDSSPLFQVIFMMLAPVLIILAGIYEKKKALAAAGAHMSWKNGIGEGFRISLIFGIISPFIFMLYYLLINSEILASVRGVYGLADQSTAFVIGFDMIVQFLSAILFGVFFSIIVAFFLKTKKINS